MWQKEKNDHPIVSLALLLALAATPMAATLVLSDSTLANSSNETPSFPLPTNVPSGTTVRIDGSSSMTTINQTLKQSFQKRFPGTQVEVATNGTDAALTALKEGKIDLAAIGRGLTPEEKNQGLEQLRVHREKIALIVSSENPFKGNLTSKQFAQIFRGEITNWSQVGGKSGKIRIIDRPEISDTRQSLKNYPAFQTAKFTTGKTATQLSEDNTAAVIRELGKDGISYVLANQVAQLPGVRVLSMHNTLPDSPRYPFSQPLVYVYKKTPNTSVSSYLGFASSNDGVAAVREARKAEAASVAIAISSSSAIASNSTTNTLVTPSATPVTANNGVTTPIAQVTDSPISTPLATTEANPLATTESTTVSTPEVTSNATVPEASNNTTNSNNANSQSNPLWWIWIPFVALGGLFLGWLMRKPAKKPETTSDSETITPNSDLTPTVASNSETVTPNPDLNPTVSSNLAPTTPVNINPATATAVGLGTIGATVAAANLFDGETQAQIPPTNQQLDGETETQISSIDGETELQFPSITPSSQRKNLDDPGFDLEAPISVVNASYPELGNVPYTPQTPSANFDLEAPTIFNPVSSDVEAPTIFNPVSGNVDEEPTAFNPLTTSNDGEAPTVFNPVSSDVEAPTIFNPVSGNTDEEPTAFNPLTTSNDVEAPTVFNPVSSDVEAPTIFNPVSGNADEVPTAFNPLTTSNDGEAPTVFNPVSGNNDVEAPTIFNPVSSDVEAPTIFNPVSGNADEVPTAFNPLTTSNDGEAPTVFNPVSGNNDVEAPTVFNPVSESNPADNNIINPITGAIAGVAIGGAAIASQIFNNQSETAVTPESSSENSQTQPSYPPLPDIWEEPVNNQENTTQIPDLPNVEVKTSSDWQDIPVATNPDVADVPSAEIIQPPTAEESNAETPSPTTDTPLENSPNLSGAVIAGGAAILGGMAIGSQLSNSDNSETDKSEASKVKDNTEIQSINSQEYAPLPDLWEDNASQETPIQLKEEVINPIRASEPQTTTFIVDKTLDIDASPETKPSVISDTALEEVADNAEPHTIAQEVMQKDFDTIAQVSPSGVNTYTSATSQVNNTTSDTDNSEKLELSPRTPKWAYASWQVSEESKLKLRNQGNPQLALRLYDVTDIDLSYQQPKFIQSYDCEMTVDDRYVAIPESDRTYMAELGYLNPDNTWTRLARSQSVRIFSRPETDFWFIADAELIIHGATEAGANVSVAGNPVKMKPDGTFHLRIPFTGNSINYVMTATRSDGKQKIIQMSFSQDNPETKGNG
ncbi:substrate-binding domain-containing protein [Calothrix sp. 336/3]|uniref:substrate-binding domain-containing protein n=1 Tax=Calothrix sp. 336/3 TaxID=1337936 RepID=UPI00069A9ACB|nr:substrate-binding domain-containing protein [Calothrix sp. 336/3]